MSVIYGASGSARRGGGAGQAPPPLPQVPVGWGCFADEGVQSGRRCDPPKVTWLVKAGRRGSARPAQLPGHPHAASPEGTCLPAGASGNRGASAHFPESSGFSSRREAPVGGGTGGCSRGDAAGRGSLTEPLGSAAVAAVTARVTVGTRRSLP